MNEITSTDMEIRHLNEKVTLLSAAVFQKKPWYRDVSSIVSLAAFVISLTTTIFAAFHESRQDLENKKNELRVVLNQITTTNIQSVEVMQKYEGTPFLAEITSILNGQNAFAAKQAYSIVVSMGSAATVEDLQSTASALGVLNEVGLSEKLVEMAKKRIENVVEYMTVYRQSGGLKLYNHRLDEGNADFQKAADVFSLYPGDANNTNFVLVTNFSTQMQWATALLPIDCRAAAVHAKIAQKLIEDQRGSQSPNLPYMRNDLERLKANLTGCK